MLRCLQDPECVKKLSKKDQKYLLNYVLDELDNIREVKKIGKKTLPPEKYEVLYKQCQSWGRVMKKLQKQIGVK